MSGPIRISVVVCTRDRLESLERLLRSATSLHVPRDLVWEMVIVDNGSSADVERLAAPYAAYLPLRVVAEPIAGLSNARNRGVAEARGRYICWTDDDCELEPNWLVSWQDAFLRHPNASFFGGSILPKLEPPTPDWFRRAQDDWPLEAVTATRRPVAAGPVDETELPWGANHAVRTDAFRGLAYNQALGYGPGRRRTGEESDLLYRLLKTGASGWWVPESSVWHHIGNERQSRRHLFSFFRTAGETASELHHNWPGQNANEAGGRRGLVHVASAMLSCIWASSAILSLLSWVPGFERTGIRFLARFGMATGILNYRRAQTLPARQILSSAGSTR